MAKYNGCLTEKTTGLADHTHRAIVPGRECRQEPLVRRLVMVSKNMVAVAIALILAVVAVLIIATARPGNEQELLHVAEARAAEAA